MSQGSKTLTVQAESSQLEAKVSQIVAAALLGLIVVFGVGFAPMDIVHNAAHDTRHSVSFPCH